MGYKKNIAERIKMINFALYQIPINPGVYVFKDAQNQIIYIGKAKNLQKRLKSYNTDKLVDWKIQYLLSKSVSLEWIVANSEEEALLVEAECISSHKPICNKLLTSHTPFSYIVFKKDVKKNIEIVSVSRIYNEKKDFIIGPFLRKKDAIELYKYIISVFRLSLCGNKIKNGCLKYHMGQCAGNCKEDFNVKAYQKRYKLAIQSVKTSEYFYTFLEKEMRKAEEDLDISLVEDLCNYRREYAVLEKYLLKIEESGFDEMFSQSLYKMNIIREEYEEAVNELKQFLSITTDLTVIDCIDISHFQGHSVAGAVVRFEYGSYSREQSTSYLLETEKNNDYENLALLVKKHYVECNRSFPDLLLIDGGRGQLSTITKLSFPIVVAALAKREEKIFSSHRADSICLSTHTALGRLLISLRNTTHNTAICLHKKEKIKQLLK